jgi:hypothetical protein
MIPLGIEPSTFWLVVQCFNQLCHCLDCINNTMIMHSRSEAMSELTAKYRRNILLILNSQQATVQKACGRNHLHISTSLTPHSNWLIMNNECKLPYDWSSYTTVTEEFTHRMSCAVKPCQFTFEVGLSCPTK